jgi:hypothetical protein
MTFYDNKKIFRQQLLSFIEEIGQDQNSNYEGKIFYLSKTQEEKLKKIVIESGFSIISLRKELELFGLEYDENKSLIRKIGV